MKIREIMNLIEEYGNRREDLGYLTCGRDLGADVFPDAYKKCFKQSIQLLQEIRKEIQKYDNT